MNKILPILYLVCIDAWASIDSNLQGRITVERGYQFQGIDQSQEETFLHIGTEYQLSDEVTAGIWVGEYVLPMDFGRSTEIDYFVAYNKQLSFMHNLHSSIWRYTFTDDELDHYNWSQWLIGYEYNGWLNFTTGIAYNFLDSGKTTSFVESMVKRHLGGLTTSLSLGRNNISRTQLDSFAYLRVKGIYNWQTWSIFADYTKTVTGKNNSVELFAADGLGVGFSFSF